MATNAGRRALEAAGWEPADIDLLVVTTVVPDRLIPPTSTLVQEALGIERCAEVEISANCTAPYKGLLFATNQLRLGQCRRALVCCSQFVSFLGVPPWANPGELRASQAHLRWILSDAAAAVALEAGEPDSGFGVWLESAGTGRPPGMELKFGAAYPDLGAALAGGLHHVTQNTRNLRRDGIEAGAVAFERMLTQFEISPAAIDHFIPEIPSMQFVEVARPLLAQRLGLRESAWRVDLPTIGNVGGAMFPVTLDRLVRAGELRPGQLVCSFAEESSKWMFSGAMLCWNP